MAYIEIPRYLGEQVNSHKIYAASHIGTPLVRGQMGSVERFGVARLGASTSVTLT